MCVIWGQFDLGLVEHPDCQFGCGINAFDEACADSLSPCAVTVLWLGAEPD